MEEHYIIISENMYGEIKTILCSLLEKESEKLFDSLRPPDGGKIQLAKIIKTKYYSQ